jgi:O-Antigen ligase
VTARLQALRSRPHLWRTVGIIAATLFLSYYLGRRPSIHYVQLPLLLAGIWIVMQHPPVGLIAILVASTLLPFSIGTGTQTSLHLGILLIPPLTAVWVANMLRQRSFHLAPSRTTLPLLGFALVATLALINGNLPLVAFTGQAPMRSQIGGWAIMVCSVAAFLMVGNQIKEIRWLKLLVWLFIGIATVYFVGRALPGIDPLEKSLADGANGSLTWLWFVALAGGLVLFDRELKFRFKLLLILGLGLEFFVAFGPEQVDWASGWLPSLVVLSVLVFLRWPRLGIALGVIAAVAGALTFSSVREFLLGGDNQYGLITRVAAAQIIGQILRASPILGVGPANYYYYTPLYSILGYYVRFNSHSQYVDLLAETGILGTFFYLWLAFEAGRVGWRLRNRLSDGFSKAYANAAVAAVAGMLVAGALGDWVLPFVYNVGVKGFRASVLGWMFLGGLVCLEYLSRREAQSETELAALA